MGQRLLAAATAAKAYGLAAAHLGDVAPVIVMTAEPSAEPHEYIVLFNPRIVAVAEMTEKGEEGSVSLPGGRADVERPVWVEVAFMDEEGRAVTRRFEGFAARVAIHEIEQTQGIFFLDRVSRLRRDMALKRARKVAGQAVS